MSILTKIIAITAAAGMLAPVAFAQGVTGGVGVDASVGVGTSRSTTTVNVDGGVSGSAGANNEARLENQDEVSVQVQGLLQVADRDGGIGAEVRDIARTYASSSARADEAKVEVESRPGWLVFIIGTDYGSLGKLKSEIETTQNQIERLTRAKDRTTDITVKAALQAQIAVLEAQASTTAAFVADNEDAFSLFGWLFRLFS